MMEPNIQGVFGAEGDWAKRSDTELFIISNLIPRMEAGLGAL
jgi:hypothetical protein